MKSILTAVVVLALTAAASGAPPAKAPSNDDCLACHGDASARRSNGTSVFVDQTRFAASVHGQAGLACVDCHADLAKTTDFPHPDKLAPVQCATCHDDQAKAYAQGVHALARRNGDGLAARCIDCHGTHDILSAKDPMSPTYPLNLPQTCGRCHGDLNLIRKAHIAIGNVFVQYEDSIHGRALNKSGLLVAPTCESCHGMHDIRRAKDPKSPVNRVNIPNTCGKCHAGVQQQYEAGVHGKQMRAGNTRAPICTDCHTAHHIVEATLASWRLDVTRECGTCHAESLESYRDTYHGQVTNLGFARIATCADCHEAHDILPPTDPRSSVSAEHRLQTCQKCHPGTNARFARYDPHPNPKNRSRDPLLYYAAIFMKWLLFSVMAFFGIHTVLWFPRSLAARREAQKKNPFEGDQK